MMCDDVRFFSSIERRPLLFGRGYEEEGEEEAKE
jgi:hypothetical protein